MIETLLMGWLSDLVFDAASVIGVRYQADMQRYMQDRGLLAPPAPRPEPAG